MLRLARRLCAIFSVAILLFSAAAIAQTATKGKGPTAQQYVDWIGAQLVPAGKLEIDGRRVTCGQNPTVLDNDINDISAAYPKFTVLNPKRLNQQTTTVKLWAYSVACGFQVRGADQRLADCFAIERGLKEGWLTAKGMNEICAFVGPTSRCERLRDCYVAARGGRQ
jgi:hypothetical protein